MSLRKRKVLTLEERVSVLDKIEKGQSCCSVAEELGVGKTQIQNIVKDKESSGQLENRQARSIPR